MQHGGPPKVDWFTTHMKDARRVPNERQVASALWLLELRDRDGSAAAESGEVTMTRCRHVTKGRQLEFVANESLRDLAGAVEGHLQVPPLASRRSE